MNLLKEARLWPAGRSPRRGIAALFLAILFALIPTFSFAGEGNVSLKFTGNDILYLWVSLGFGVIALAAAAYLAVKTMARDPGSHKMQEVSQAIKEGALAYLKRQIGTMVIFIVILALGLYILYRGQWGDGLAIAIAGCFVGGVAASYIAGFVGMIMAVNGNTRTAAAALKSYKSALETAFQSGAVAGMVTVGMGLIGATLIFLLAKGEAMKLLVGFGFGGSLAALFMRVGGGIFTKAADVGADLVGKVEAGIPEDDPRNPATIADNVGDNVGDCAGMAADVFESYEVTLVAAIILGAATASIFDQPTWMKLILFALMARGVGILASIVGIFSVRGSDDVDKDPLKPITNGFWVSAGVAAIATFILAWGMMGGQGGSSIISRTAMESQQEMIQADAAKIQSIRNEIAKAAGKKPDEVTVKEMQADQRIKDLGFGENMIVMNQDSSRLLPQIMGLDLNNLGNAQPLTGMAKADFSATDVAAFNYAVPERGATGEPSSMTVKDKFKDLVFTAYKVKRVYSGATTPKPMTVESVELVARDPKTSTETFEDRINKENKTGGGVTAEIVGKYDANLYVNNSGGLAIAIEGKIPSVFNLNVDQSVPTQYYTKTPTELESYVKDMQAGKEVAPSTPKTISIAAVEHKTVEWWRFPLCLVFGIGMAFLIERLTDYYVSLHKKPVQEVAGTSTTGPATMIITGFAYGMESSVFSVFSIVIALIAPLLIFPPAEYGGYILSFYGIALVGLGLLTTTGFILAEDTFGPISDNAQGVYEMSGEGHDNEKAAKAVQRLDAAGNTTKALTKGFAIATAVVAAVALYHSYLEDAGLAKVGLRLEIPEIFLGLLIGGAAPYLFSAFSINAVGRAAFKLINEVRRQFREDAGIMAGTSKPNYGRCVAIVTQAAQQELLGPGIIAIALPAAVAFGFSIGKPTVGGLNLTGAQALGGYLAGAILSGQLLAVMLANSGGIWDNAKKYIEDGAYGGKGSEAHKAGVVCDTVGDPFKDTAGPALNPLIKVMNLVALLLAPIVIQPFGNATLITITACCVAALAFSVYWSKRASMSSELGAMEAATKALDTAKADVPAPKRITVDDDKQE